MKKLIAWCKDNFFAVSTLFLLAFIPLYPKLPLVDIKNTWVYIRAEDFFVFGVLLIWIIQLFRGKYTLRTPLTVPILVFWLVGVVATIHGVLIIFPTVANVFPNVAFLSFLRRIEYMSLFFIAFSSVRRKWVLPAAFVVIIGTLLATSVYGIGQKYFSLPAYLTMNEEFAKGVPIQLSALSRVPSTFAGHYDFAAFLVLSIPIAFSVFLRVSSWVLKACIGVVLGVGLLALLMTVSRISLVALVIALTVVLYATNRKIILYVLPFVLVFGVIFVRHSPAVLDRIVSTIKQVDVLVDASSGRPIGKVSIVPNTYFEGKVIKQQFFRSTTDAEIAEANTAKIIIPYTDLPAEVALLARPDAHTGEELPEGTGYINLTLSPIIKKLNQFFYELNPTSGTGSVEVQIINGQYLIKRTYAYDVSFTTRFQAEWPHALAAFKKSILTGSGYGSVSLAIDNSYLRMLGEVGLAGFLAFAAIFVASGIYISRAWRSIDSEIIKSIIVGSIAGFFGLLVNAVFIDVFEASKIAFVLWILVGIIMGTVRLYQKREFYLQEAFVRIVTSPPAVVIYLLTLVWGIYGQMIGNYFVGDDFTWLRWAAGSTVSHVQTYFTDAAGFFYRPGAKLYFAFMYHAFWLNQLMYHAVSLMLHSIVVVLVFFLSRKIFNRTLFGALTAGIFALLGGFSEAVFWISATGFLFATVFALGALLSLIRWHETGSKVYFIFGWIMLLASPLFHELGVVAPLLFFVYLFSFNTLHTRLSYLFILAPIPVYLFMRFLAGSHWLSGDYNYNLIKLPFNAVGNMIGYVLTALAGPAATPVYVSLRHALKDNLGVSFIILCLLFFIVVLFRKSIRIANISDRNIVWFAVLFSIVALLPFLGLGNISPRYGYMGGIGLSMFLSFVIQKIYATLAASGRFIALSVTGLGIGIFCLYHIIQLISLHDNWHEAGEKVRTFVVSIDSAYEDVWQTSPMEFYFVDVPIKAGEAWIFPVGIPDALWFVFQNPSIRIFQNSTVEEALSFVSYESPTQKVFVFDETGRVTERKKPRSAQ